MSVSIFLTKGHNPLTTMKLVLGKKKRIEQSQSAFQVVRIGIVSCKCPVSHYKMNFVFWFIAPEV